MLLKNVRKANICENPVDNKILVDEQYGFRINSFTVKATHK
jgi:hypothetical protein